MYCVECGNKLTEEIKFCPRCGTKSTTFNKRESRQVKEGKEVEPRKDLDIPHETPLCLPLSKLIVLSITTFGIYEVYWFYKNWKAIKEIKNLKVTPWARAIFAPIFAYSLFKHIFELASEMGKKEDHSPGLLWALYFALSVLWRLPDPWWLISFGTFLPLLAVQESLNYYCQAIDPSVEISRGYNGWESLIVAIGGIILLLVLVGSFVG